MLCEQWTSTYLHIRIIREAFKRCQCPNSSLAQLNQNLGVDVGYCYVFKTPGEIQTCRQAFHPLIQALNFRETGPKLRSWIDAFTWCLSCIPVPVAKSRNSLLGTHTRQVFLVVLVVMFFFVHCGSLLPLLRCF